MSILSLITAAGLTQTHSENPVEGRHISNPPATAIFAKNAPPATGYNLGGCNNLWMILGGSTMRTTVTDANGVFTNHRLRKRINYLYAMDCNLIQEKE